MIISKHIHYRDFGDISEILVCTFDPPRMFQSTLGKIDPFYPNIPNPDLPGHKEKLLKVVPIINKNDILHFIENVKVGEILSFEIRIGYRLSEINIDPTHNIQLYAGQFGLMYLITIGKDCSFQMTAKLIKDKDKFYDKLKANLDDTALRDYYLRLSLISAREIDKFPGIMTHKQAAEYIKVEPSTLYNISKSQIPRLSGNKYSKKSLDDYLNRNRTKRKGR